MQGGDCSCRAVRGSHSRLVSSARFSLKCLSLGVLTSVASVTAMAEPVVPGFDRLAAHVGSADVSGNVLLGELNCVSCHQADEAIGQRIPTKSAPLLSGVGSRVTPQYLREFLTNTHATKPGTSMPDLFHGVPAEQRTKDVEDLVHFLVSKGGGVPPTKKGGSDRLVEQGRALYHSVGCVACHAPEKDADKLTSASVPLGKLAKKTTVDVLSKFLMDPLKVRPSGRMPNLNLAQHEARAIAVYLLRDQLKQEGAAKVARKEHGVEWQYFEAPMGDKLPDFEKLTPTKSGTHSTITFNMSFQKRRQDFAMRWKTTINIPSDGKWSFFTVSDDGSSILIDGKVVVDNDGVHTRQEKSGSVELTAGDHEMEVRYFQKVTGAVFGVGWQGPNTRKQRIPSSVLYLPTGQPMAPLESEEFELDLTKVERGSKVFAAQGCASCHSLDGLKAPSYPNLASLKPEAAGGCLSAAPSKKAPKYDLSEKQRSALSKTLASQTSLKEVIAPADLVHHHMAAMNCYACHQRGELGGPDDSRRELFKTKVSIDLGEEGKIPPNLNTVGSKLRKEALEKILYHGELHVRGRYMSTRMPVFGKGNVEDLLEAFVKVDAQEGDREAPEFNYGSARDGQALVGTSGVSCIACHNVAGRQGQGIPGIDLATVSQRLNPGWMRRFFLDPGAFNKDTRMPGFWPNGVASFQKIAKGDTRAQMDALWNYFSLGKSMPPPPGVAEEGGAGSELKPTLSPIVHRTFMTDVGPRAIVAGFPERVHVAFDANVVRLAKAWRGRFFDASGVASGRSDKFFGPLGTDVIDMPPGPAFAKLASPNDAWPKAEKLDRNVGGRFRGYQLDDNGMPTFFYELEGVRIAEQPAPTLKPGGAVLVRKFTLTADAAAEISLLAAAGAAIDAREGEWSVDKKLSVKVVSETPLAPRLRPGGPGQELIVPLKLAAGAKLEFEVHIQW